MTDKAIVVEDFFDIVCWYANESVFGLSDLGVYMSRLCAVSALTSEPLRMKQVYSTTKHSHAAIRKYVAALVSAGHANIVHSEDDRRAKNLEFSERFLSFQESHAEELFHFVRRHVDRVRC